MIDDNRRKTSRFRIEQAKEYFDQAIISRITANIAQNAGENGHYRKTINGRRKRRYYRQFAKEYDALLHACEYLELAVRYKDLPGASAHELFGSYVDNLYKLDSSYRRFILAYDRLDDDDAFGALFDMVENSYTNWFLNELPMKWCAFWDDAPPTPSKSGDAAAYNSREALVPWRTT